MAALISLANTFMRSYVSIYIKLRWNLIMWC